MKRSQDDSFTQLWCYLWAALEIDDNAAQQLARAMFDDGRIKLDSALPVWEQWANLPAEDRSKP